MNQTSQKNRKIIEVLAASVILCFCELFFFRNVLDANALFSDRVDGRLTTLLTEHWWQVLCGNESFSELAMFYPVEGVLGYTDMFLGYGILFCLFRAFHLDMFFAYKCTLIVVHCMGTIFMYYLFKKKLHTSLIWSLFGTMAFSFSDTYARHTGHTQLIAVSVLPILLILFIGFIQNFSFRKKRNIYAYSFIFGFVLLTYNSWYVAYFTGLFGLFFLVIYLIQRKRKCQPALAWFMGQLKILGIDCIGYLVVTALLYLPFIKIYVPVLFSSSGYPYVSVVGFLPEIADLINVSESNFLLGRIMGSLQLSERGYSSEVEMGFSIILLAVFLGMYWLNQKSERDENVKILLNSVFYTILFSICCIIRLSANGVSLWWVFYHVIPGAASVRAIARFLLWLSFPMSIVAAVSANRYLRNRKKTVFYLCSVSSLLLLFLSNINKIGVSQFWSREDEITFLSKVANPPEDLDCFYIIDTANTGDPAYIYQLDAFEIATHFHIKTINGYSGQFPADWNNLWEVTAVAYEPSISAWKEKYDLQNIYAYDRAENIWTKYEDRIQSMEDSVFHPLENRFSVSSGLMDYSCGEFAWTSREFSVNLKNSDINNNNLVIRMITVPEEYLKQNPDIMPSASLYIDGTYVQDLPVIDGYAEYLIPITGHESDEYHIEITLNTWFNPKDIGESEDNRDLCIAMYYIGN